MKNIFKYLPLFLSVVALSLIGIDKLSPKTEAPFYGASERHIDGDFSVSGTAAFQLVSITNNLSVASTTVNGVASSTSLVIGGGGTAIDLHKSATFTVNPNIIGGTNNATYTLVSVAGASVGDTVIVTPDPVWRSVTSTSGYSVISGFVSSTGIVAVTFSAPTSVSIDLFSGTGNVDVWSH